MIRKNSTMEMIILCEKDAQKKGINRRRTKRHFLKPGRKPNKTRQEIIEYIREEMVRYSRKRKLYKMLPSGQVLTNWATWRKSVHFLKLQFPHVAVKNCFKEKVVVKINVLTHAKCLVQCQAYSSCSMKSAVSVIIIITISISSLINVERHIWI